MSERASPAPSTPPPAEGLTARLALIVAFTVGVFGALALRRQGLRLEGLVGLSEARLAWALFGLALGAAAGLWSTARLAVRAQRPLFALGAATLLASSLESFWAPATRLLGSPDGMLGRSLATALGLAVPAATLFAVLPFALVCWTRASAGERGGSERLASAFSAGAAAGLALLGGVLGALAANAGAVIAAQRVALVVGLVVLIRGARAKLPAAVAPTGPVLAPRTLRLALAAAALAGATVAALVLSWVRVADLVMGPAPTVRAMVIAPLLLGAALGFAWAARQAGASPIFDFARRQLGFLAVGAALLVLLPRFPWLMLSLGRMVRHTPPAWLPWQLVRLLVGSLSAGPLAFFCAASLASVARLLGASLPPARSLALVGSAAALGTAALALVAQAVPVLVSSAPALCVAAVVLGAFGAMIALTVRVEVPWSKARRQGFLTAAGLVGVASSAWLTIDLQLGAEDLAVAGRGAEWPLPIGSFARFRKTLADRGTVVFRRDDLDATATVEEQGGRRSLRVNGHLEATSRETVELERLAAHLGALVGEAPPRSAMVLGPRSGAAVQALLAYPLEHLTVVAASRSELEAARAFAPEHAVAFADPRVALTVDGLTAAVRRHAGSVNLIVASVTPGAASEAFTDEFITAARARLGPDGRLVLRLDVGDWPDAVVRRALRTVRAEFESGTTWGSDDEAWLLLSSRALTLTPEALAPRMAEPKVARSLAALGVTSPMTLLAHQLQSDAVQKAFAADGRVNTRDDDLVGFGADVAAFAPADWKFPDERRAIPPGTELAITQATSRTALTAAQARELHFSLASVDGLRDPLARAAAELWLENEPASEPASAAVARAALAQGNPNAAKIVLEPLIVAGAKSPEVVAAWLETERALLRREGAPWNPLRIDAALELGREVLAKAPDYADLAEAVQKLEEVR